MVLGNGSSNWSRSNRVSVGTSGNWELDVGSGSDLWRFRINGNAHSGFGQITFVPILLAGARTRVSQLGQMARMVSLAIDSVPFRVGDRKMARKPWGLEGADPVGSKNSAARLGLKNARIVARIGADSRLTFEHGVARSRPGR